MKKQDKIIIDESSINSTPISKTVDIIAKYGWDDFKSFVEERLDSSKLKSIIEERIDSALFSIDDIGGKSK